MRKYILWRVNDLVEIAKQCRAKKFDCIICLSGERGKGKSTLGYKILTKCGGKPRKDILFSQEEVLKAIHDWERAFMADEMINISFKREFFQKYEIELVKGLNMNRDHKNILIMCIPNFWDLDKPVRDMVRIRIDVIRRGLGIVHTPIHSMYTNDCWDMKNNQKTEMGWSKMGNRKPRFSKLSTFKGIIKFGPLKVNQERKYQKIKNDKRAKLLEKGEEAKQKVEEFEKKRYDVILDKVKEGTYSKDILLELCRVNGWKWSKLRGTLSRKLSDDGYASTLNTLLTKNRKNRAIAVSDGTGLIIKPKII